VQRCSLLRRLKVLGVVVMYQGRTRWLLLVLARLGSVVGSICLVERLACQSEQQRGA
jgi:hypothetical protein